MEMKSGISSDDFWCMGMNNYAAGNLMDSSVLLQYLTSSGQPDWIGGQDTGIIGFPVISNGIPAEMDLPLIRLQHGTRV